MRFGYKGIGGTKAIIKRALTLFILHTKEEMEETAVKSKNYGNLDWDVRRANDIIESIDDKVNPTIMRKSGGQWLGAAREWIQWNFSNGSDVIWGSQDVLKGKDLTVHDIENLASIIAAAAVNEDRE